MVSLGSASANGQTVFAKNSDRPAGECQPLVMRPCVEEAADRETRCQFVTVPGAPISYRHVGSRPFWCWGYEHGFNEHQVVLGNEALPSRLKPADSPKLIGMEIVRLALERAATAREAVDVTTSLIESHGQGKFENDRGVRTYDNLYLVADPREAFVIEAAGHEWAAQRVGAVHSISNVGMLGADAERVSGGASAAAENLSLYDPTSGRPFGFADAFADRDRSGSGIARQRRSAALLKNHEGRIGPRTLMRILSDHSDGERPDEPFVDEIRGEVSICVHREGGDFPGSTAASLVADLCGDGSRLPVYWCGLSSPCMALFYPVFVEGDLPPVLGAGGAAPSDDSPWWVFRRLTLDGLRGGPDRQAEIKGAWRGLQNELLGSAYDLAVRAREMISAGQQDEASRVLTEYMGCTVTRMLDAARALLDEKGRGR